MSFTVRDVLEEFAAVAIDRLPAAALAHVLRVERLTIHAPEDRSDPCHLAARRAGYDRGRRTLSDDYLAMLEQRQQESLERWADPERRAAIQRHKESAADTRRAVKARGRLCPECGLPVEPRARMGRVPSLHPKCNRRRASRAWWKREHGKRVYAVCAVCPNEYLKRNSRHLTCSSKCSEAHRLKRARERWHARQKEAA